MMGIVSFVCCLQRVKIFCVLFATCEPSVRVRCTGNSSTDKFYDDNDKLNEHFVLKG